MEPYWGADSYLAANAQINIPQGFREPGRPGRQMLFDFVQRLMGEPPEFWGRYLNPYGEDSSALQPGESDFLHRRGCRILLAYNGPRGEVWRETRSGRRYRIISAGYRSGYRAAQNACDLARNRFHVPRGVRIYADLEGWPVNPDWIHGWWDYMHGSEYAGMGGLYGRGGELPWSALSNPTVRPRHPTRRVRGEPNWWSSNVPGAADQQAARLFEQDLDQLAAFGTRRSGTDASRYVWSNIPRRSCEFPRDRQRPTSFRGVGPPTHLTDTVIWQYSLNCFRTIIATPSGQDREIALFDLNLAREAGYRDMWGPRRSS
jgi:hypothetical protein